MGTQRREKTGRSSQQGVVVECYRVKLIGETPMVFQRYIDNQETRRRSCCIWTNTATSTCPGRKHPRVLHECDERHGLRGDLWREREEG